MMTQILLTRDQFREAVFSRDKHECVNCVMPGQDAHHIIERRLFPDGGYYLDNGATVCGNCHVAAESTILDCDTLRHKAGIQSILLPPDFETDTHYDKWGNPILEDGTRLRGPLFGDENVQKALAAVLHLFSNRIKYPRTFHLPWSPGLSNDDRMLESPASGFGKQGGITKKLDGETTTMYRDGLHARSIEFTSRPDRDRIRAIHAEIAYEIPENMRICGENLTAKHSIKYTNLEDWFYVYSIWEWLTCLSWKDTIEWCTLLGMNRGRPLAMVPLLYWGEYSDDMCRTICDSLDSVADEGLVTRPAGCFQLKEFPRVVGKFVRKGHVQTTEHWTRRIEYNEVKL